MGGRGRKEGEAVEEDPEEGDEAHVAEGGDLQASVCITEAVQQRSAGQVDLATDFEDFRGALGQGAQQPSGGAGDGGHGDGMLAGEGGGGGVQAGGGVGVGDEWQRAEQRGRGEGRQKAPVEAGEALQPQDPGRALGEGEARVARVGLLPGLDRVERL